MPLIYVVGVLIVASGGELGSVEFNKAPTDLHTLPFR